MACSKALAISSIVKIKLVETPIFITALYRNVPNGKFKQGDNFRYEHSPFRHFRTRR